MRSHAFTLVNSDKPAESLNQKAHWPNLKDNLFRTLTDEENGNIKNLEFSKKSIISSRIMTDSLKDVLSKS